ncbi:hypothetical protein cypCar_00049508 [Cyprinus carpio]|nr:hypothetical protein cypCar_00049508 [Cyprinus carpio]
MCLTAQISGDVTPGTLNLSWMEILSHVCGLKAMVQKSVKIWV